MSHSTSRRTSTRSTVAALLAAATALAAPAARSQVFPPEIDLGALDGDDGFVLRGVAANQWTGVSVAQVPDFDGDGIDDFVLGAQLADGEGRAYLLYGDGAGFPAVFELSTLDGSAGAVLNGAQSGEWTGFAVAGGDFDGDGRGDLAIAAPRWDPPGAPSERGGRVFVVFGVDGGIPSPFDLGTLDGSNGFVVEGEGEGDVWTGFAVANAGDFDGDGVDDLLIGAPFQDRPAGTVNAGSAYLVFGDAGGFPAVVSLAALDGSDGFELRGGAAGDRAGISVAGAGDVDDDGFADLVVGARTADADGRVDAGAAYVVFGTDAALSSTVSLADLDGSDGFALRGAAAGDEAGLAVAGVGDLNGDGVDDLAVGARNADPGGRTDAGATYVVFGSPSGFPATVELSALDGSDGFALLGVDPGDLSGRALSGGGDLNGDGDADLVIGAWAGDLDLDTPGPESAGPESGGKRTGGQVVDAGEVYVFFGRSTPFPATVELSSLDGTDGFVARGVGEGDATGLSVALRRDVDDDGLADLLVGAVLADPAGRTDAGAAYVVLGDLNTAPQVAITEPADGATFDAATSIDFLGTATDGEDGDLDAQLAWTSDLDGAIGSGGSFTTTLSPGPHTITASVEDSSGVAGSDQIGIEVFSDACPLDLVVGAQVISTATTFRAVRTITVQSGVEVVAPGVLTLEAGTRVIFENGFEVHGDGGLAVEISTDPCGG